jgi:uncharacterized membrane protein
MFAERIRTAPDARRVQAFYLAYGAAICTFLFAAVPLSWISRDLGAVRNWQIALNGAALLVLLRWWTPGAAAPQFRFPRALLYATCAAGAWLFLACQLSRFYSFDPNGFDFSIFDWMLYNTNRGRFGYSPLYGVNHFGVHASYFLLLFVPLHRALQTPLLLVVTTALALWAGVIPLWRLAQHYLRSEAQAFLVLVAYLTNPWLGRLLDGGFRPENFYPLLGLTFAAGWVLRKARIWFLALLAFLCIKEDAAFYIAALSLASLLFESQRWRPALLCLVLSVLLLALNIAFLQPLFLAESNAVQPEYLHFWGKYGRTLGEIVRGMIASPLRVASDVLTSAWYKLFGPALFLPFLSRIPLAAMAPAILLLGSASNPTMRHYRAYYAVPLLPFFFWGLLDGYQTLASFRRVGAWRDGILAAALLLFPLLGDGYIRFHRPDGATIRGLKQVEQQVDGRRPVCAQPVLFPHLPYSWNLQPLSRGCVQQPGALSLVNPLLDPFPYTRAQLEEMLAHAKSNGRVQRLEAGFAILSDPSIDAR